MKCPRCRCEVGSRSVCPYCGSTVYVGDTTWGVQDYSRRTTTTVPPHGRPSPETRNLERKMRNLETKVNLILVLQGGIFALTMLALIMLVLK